MATTTSLPTLTGTEKQVAWAEQIRAEAMAAVETYVSASEARTGKSRNAIPMLVKCLATLTSEARASWWIENRQTGIDGQRWLQAAGTKR